LADTPTLYELMDQYKTPDALRRLASVMLGSGAFGLWPMLTSPGTPEDQVKALRSAFAKALGSTEFQDEAQKKTLEANLLPGDELQALSKEVVVQPPEIIGQIRKLMGE
jgi:hypothetical protein